jgi:hypothetical protein
VNRLLDWLLGKRYVPHWPRGVQPVVPGLAEHFEEIDPVLWRDTRFLPMTKSLRLWRERYPGSI